MTVNEGEGLALQHFRTIDDGASWQGPHRVDPGGSAINPPHRGVDPQIAARGDLVVAAFTTYDEESPFGTGGLALSRSLDGGATWQAIDAPSVRSSGGQGFIDLAIDDSGALHVVWLDSRDGGQGLRYATSKDAALTWSENLTLDSRTCECCSNTIHLDRESHVSVLYRDKDPRDMALVSRDIGSETWTRLGPVGEFDWAFDGCPHVGGGLAETAGPGGGRLHAAVWTGKEAVHGIYTLVSEDMGVTWSEPLRLDGDLARNPDMAALGSKVYVAYDQRVAGDSAVYGSSSDDGGRSWNSGGRLSEEGYDASHPKVVANGSVVVVLWTERDQRQPMRWSYRVLGTERGRTRHE